MTEQQFNALVRLIRSVAKVTFIEGVGEKSSESEEILETIIKETRQELVEEDWQDLI